MFLKPKCVGCLPSHRGSRQVSDEFDQYMERASLEALMALAMLCKEAREARPPPCATPLSVPPTLRRTSLTSGQRTYPPFL